MTGKKGFCARELRDDHRPVLRHLSSTCFVFAGFSFASLSLLISLYRWQLETAGNMISILLVCSVLFLLGGEFARETHKVWEYLVAEASYLVGTGLLLFAFLVFALTLPGIYPVAIVALVVGMLAFFAKATWDVYAVATT